MSNDAHESTEQLGDAPRGDGIVDNDYQSRPGQKDDAIPVDADDKPVESGLEGDQDTDEQLAKDDTDAIDEANIIEGDRTRGAGPEGGYREPGDDEGLPTDDGSSSGAAQ